MIQLKIQTKTLRSSLSQFFVFLAVCLTLYSCAGPENSDINVFMGNKMTIDYRLVVAGHLTSSDKEIIQKIVDNSFDLINQTFNYWNLDSEISQLNLLPSKTKTAISPQLYSFFQTIDQLVQISDGLFDPTIKVAHDFWLKKLKKSDIPTEAEINQLKKSIGWQNIAYTSTTFEKLADNVKIDLGGIAKGLLVDIVVENLNKAGYRDVLMEWGGEIRASGRHPSDRPWKIEVRNPKNSDKIIIDLKDEAIATSGDYYQFWQIKLAEGNYKTFCHILDPRSASFLEVNSTSLASATIIAKTCVTADALAKVLMIINDEKKARKWLTKIQVEQPDIKGLMLRN